MSKTQIPPCQASPSHSIIVMSWQSSIVCSITVLVVKGLNSQQMPYMAPLMQIKPNKLELTLSTHHNVLSCLRRFGSNCINNLE